MTSADLLRLRKSALVLHATGQYRLSIGSRYDMGLGYTKRARMYLAAAEHDRSERRLLILDYLAERRRRKRDGPFISSVRKTLRPYTERWRVEEAFDRSGITGELRFFLPDGIPDEAKVALKGVVDRHAKMPYWKVSFHVLKEEAR